MIWAFLLINTCVIVLTARLRYADDGLAFASPIPMESATWWWLAGGLAVLSLGAGIADRNCLRRPEARQALAEMSAVFLPLLVYLWAIRSSSGISPRDFAFTAAMAIFLALVFWRDRHNVAEWGVTSRNFLPAARWLAAPTAVMCVLSLALVPFGGTDLRIGNFGVSLLTYPFWALAQLFLFQTFLVPRLRRVEPRRPAIVVVAAGMFALVHWPNGLLMAACGAAALVWTFVYLRWPNIYAPALSMGVAATVLTQVPSRDITQHTRVGPSYVQLMQRTVHLELIAALASPRYFAQNGGTNHDFVAALYRDLLHRAPDPFESGSWVAALERRSMSRAEIVRGFLDSDEFRMRLTVSPTNSDYRR